MLHLVILQFGIRHFFFWSFITSFYLTSLYCLDFLFWNLLFIQQDVFGYCLVEKEKKTREKRQRKGKETFRDVG